MLPRICGYAQMSTVPPKRGRPPETPRVRATIHLKKAVLVKIDAQKKLEGGKSSRGKVVESKFE